MLVMMGFRGEKYNLKVHLESLIWQRNNHIGFRSAFLLEEISGGMASSILMGIDCDRIASRGAHLPARRNSGGNGIFNNEEEWRTLGIKRARFTFLLEKNSGGMAIFSVMQAQGGIEALRSLVARTLYQISLDTAFVNYS